MLLLVPPPSSPGSSRVEYGPNMAFTVYRNDDNDYAMMIMAMMMIIMMMIMMTKTMTMAEESP